MEPQTAQRIAGQLSAPAPTRRPAELRTGRDPTVGERVYNYFLDKTGSHGVAKQMRQLAEAGEAVNPAAAAYRGGRTAAEGVTEGDPFKTGLGAAEVGLSAVPGMALGVRASQNVARRADDLLKEVGSQPTVSNVTRGAAKRAFTFDDAMRRGAVTPEMVMDLQGARGRVGSLEQQLMRLPTTTMRAPAGRQTAIGAGVGAGLGAGQDLATNEFSPDSYQDWLRLALSTGTGATAGAAGERVGAHLARRRGPEYDLSGRYPEQQRTVMPEDIAAGQARTGTAGRYLDERIKSGERALSRQRPRRASEPASDQAPAPTQTSRRAPESQSGRAREEVSRTEPTARPVDPQRSPEDVAESLPGEGQRSPGGSVTSKRTPRFSPKQKVALREAFADNGGKLSLKQAKAMAPGVPEERIKAYLKSLDDVMKALRKGGEPLERFKDLKDVLKAVPAPAAVGTGLAVTGDER